MCRSCLFELDHLESILSWFFFAWITNSRVWHRNHARCIFPGSFLSLKEERADVRKNGRWVGRYLAARSSLFLKRKLYIKVVSIIMNTGPHMHIWYMDYLRCYMAWFGTHPVVYPTFPGDARLKAAKPWLRSLAYVRFANLMVSRATLQHWCSAEKSGIIPQATHIKTPKNHQSVFGRILEYMLSRSSWRIKV